MFPASSLQKFKYLFAGGSIKIAGRLISKDKGRFLYNGAGYGYTLLLYS